MMRAWNLAGRHVVGRPLAVIVLTTVALLSPAAAQRGTPIEALRDDIRPLSSLWST